MGTTQTVFSRLALLMLALFVCACGATETAERDVPPAPVAPELVRNSPRLGHPAVNVAEPALRSAWITAAQMRADESFHFKSSDSVITARNGAQSFRVTIAGGTVALATGAFAGAAPRADCPTGERSARWQPASAARGTVELSLRRWGTDEALAAAPTITSTKPDSNRVELERGAKLSEWYVNGPLGLEQGFTVYEPPLDRSGARQLVLEVAVNDGLLLQTLSGGAQVELRRMDGSLVAQYGEAFAHDATGAPLATHLEAVEGALRIRVESAGARYPILIDPLVWLESEELLAGHRRGSGRMGGSVAVEGDTAVIGAPLDSDIGPGQGIAYIFVRSATLWSEEAKLLAPDAAPGDQFGASVAISGGTVVIGAPGDDGVGTDSGSAHVFVRSGTVWTPEQKLVPSDGSALGHFGASVAISQDTALVGADYQGAAYAFVRSGTTWTEQQKLVAGDGNAGDRFGASVQLSGETGVVGAPFANGVGASGGSAYVFVRSGTTWAQQQELVGADTAQADDFGTAVSISGERVLIGASGDDDGGDHSGSAYVFVRSGTTWTQEQKIVAPDGTTLDRFGGSVSLSADTAVVGAGTDGPGSAYVFVRTSLGWSEQQKLVAAATPFGDEGFGLAVSVSADTALIGAPLRDGETGFAYAFVRSGATWANQQGLFAADSASRSELGRSVAVSSDTAVVGAPNGGEAGLERGAAHVFSSTVSAWQPQQVLLAADGSALDRFGYAVALSADTVVVGAPGDDDAGDGSGSAYVFFRSGTSWALQQKLLATDPSSGAAFGFSVALAGDTVVVGAPDADRGAAYVFTRSGTTWAQQQKLLATSGEVGDRFGSSVALSGETVIVGAPEAWTYPPGASAVHTGAAYVFLRAGTIWAQEQRLITGDASSTASLGRSVALSGDTALAGASSAAYVFFRSGATWTEQAKLVSGQSGTDSSFGSSVAVLADTAMVGFPTSGDDSRLVFNGETHVFVRTGTSWAPTQRLTALDATEHEMAGDLFGTSLSLSATTALIGAPSDDSADVDGGSAYVFVLGNPLPLGRPCTENPACESGFCVDGVCCDSACGGSSLADCIACSTATGATTEGVCAIVPDLGPTGTQRACNDGDLCTTQDHCVAGSCTGSTVFCDPPGVCQEYGQCDPATGECTLPPKTDGTPCPTGVCMGGVCVVGADAGDAGMEPSDAMSPPAGSGGAGSDGSAMGGNDGAAVGGDASPPSRSTVSGGGCGCRVASSSGADERMLSVIAMFVVAVRVRRRRRLHASLRAHPTASSGCSARSVRCATPRRARSSMYSGLTE